jgi:membrane protein DedA with SNARE-associated domain
VLRFIRRHPFAGLLLALSIEAWIAVPGEALIALAASSLVSRGLSLARMAAGGIAGMLINDFVLFGLSRAGRGVVVRWIGVHGLHFHLSAEIMLAAKFIPPLRSAAYVIYGLQGTPFSRFLWVSLVSSLLWVTVYALIGQSLKHRIGSWMNRLESRSRWITAAEIGLTLAAAAALFL